MYRYQFVFLLLSIIISISYGQQVTNSLYTGVFTNSTLTAPVPTNLVGSAQLFWSPNPVNDGEYSNVTLKFHLEGLQTGFNIGRVEIHGCATPNNEGSLLRNIRFPLGTRTNNTYDLNMIFFFSQIDYMEWAYALQSSVSPNYGVYITVQYQSVFQIRAQLSFAQALPEPTATPTNTPAPTTTTECGSSCAPTTA